MSNGGIGIGRIVHYVLDGGVHRPAIVTEVVGDSGAGPEGAKAAGDPHVNLTVFMDVNDYAAFGTTTIWHGNVAYDERGNEGTWHWAERL